MEVADSRWVGRDVFEQMVGRLQFALQCYPAASRWMHSLRRVLRAQFRARPGMVRVTSAVSADLRDWAAAMRDPEHEGVPLARTAASPADGRWGVIYADASGTGGFSAWTFVEGVVYMVADEWRPGDLQLDIATMELLASTVGLVTFAHLLPSHVLSYTDNTVALAAMRSMSAVPFGMQRLLARRAVWMRGWGGVEASRRITSAANVWADVGSRPEKGGWRAVQAMAAAAGCGFVLLGAPPSWRDTADLVTCD